MSHQANSNICLASNDSLIDLNQLWYTSLPLFHRCFLKTIPIWTLLLLLIILAPFHFFKLVKARLQNSKSIPLNFYNVSRFVSIAVIVFLECIHLFYSLSQNKWQPNDNRVSLVDLSASLLNCFTFLAFGFLLNLHRLYGIHTSGPAWIFTFTTLLLALPQAYMYSLQLSVFDVPIGTVLETPDVFELVLFLLHFTCLFVLFGLTCFADRRPSEKPPESGLVLSSIGGSLLAEDLQNCLNFGLLSSTSLRKRSFRFLPKFSEDSTSSQQNTKQRECPDQSASFLSLRTYWWFYGFGFTSLYKNLTLDDLWQLNPAHRCKTIVDRFYRLWFEQIESRQDSNLLKDKRISSPCISSLLVKEFGCKFIQSSFLKLAQVCLIFVLPQLLKICIEFIQTPISSNSPTWHGYFISACFLFVSTLQSFLMNYYLHEMYSMGMKIRSGLTSFIYRKALHLNASAQKRANSGEIVSLLSVDVQRFADLLPYLNLLWSAPLMIAFTMWFLWIELGSAIVAGLLVMGLIFLIDRRVSKREKQLQMEQMKWKDRRIQLIGELFAGIRTVKLHNWEGPFLRRVTEIRNREIEQLRRIAYIGVVTSFLWTSAPFLVSFATFSAYILSSPENRLDATKAFVSLSLLNILKFPFAIIPQLANTIVKASVSVSRLNAFLNDEELEEYVLCGTEDSNLAVEIVNGTFSWEQNEPILNGLNLKIPKGSLVAICGYSGSGKSSLLSVLLGSMNRLEGTVRVGNPPESNNQIAYVAQSAWIQSMTLRENILFGERLNGRRYESVLELCALKADIAILEAGDQTEIGEKGINLSGGQKQRIALARAAYSRAPLLLLDDPLASVDSHIAGKLFQKVISNSGFLKNRTRLMATNDFGVLPEFDQIILLQNGRITETGTYSQLMANGGDFARYMQKNIEEKRGIHQMSNYFHVSIEESQTTRHSSIDSMPSRKYTESQSIHKGLFCESEKTETGRVKLSVYAQYFRLLTCLWLSMMLVGFIGMQIASVVSSIWLAIWSNDHSQTSEETKTTKYLFSDVSRRNKRLVVYTIIGLAQGLFFLLGAVSMAKGTINSSQTLHQYLLERLIRSPVSFFDATPLGRIINRFSTDFDTIDTVIPNILRALLICLLQVVSIFVLISTEVPAFMLVIFPVLVIYYVIQKFYVTISRQLKRLESVTRSPIFSHFTETLSGMPTIRAFGVATRFIRQSDHLVDSNQQCCYPNFIANRWLASRLEMCGNLIVFSVALFAVHSRKFYQTQAGFVALLITYALSITSTLNWFIRMSSEMENSVVSVERIGEYAENQLEPEWNRETNLFPSVPESWPERGEIEFVDVSVKYRNDLNLALKNVSLRIGSGEKIGIVGQSGSGKSTLSLALFRLIEATEGSIVIDGIDISQIGLQELRSKLAIIPQEPVLFSGSIRRNLDPFESYSDESLWIALEQCHLRDFLLKNEGLDFQVTENGSNLSLGQQQLLCLGRALLRKAKILVLDEATGSIDLETDGLIQKTIREQGANCTVLTIAHRLHTILHCDRVLVLHQGKVVEFDSPKLLLQNTTSRFYELAKDERLI